MTEPLTVLFHYDQLDHQPQFEWISGERVLHPESSTRAQGILDCLAAEGSRYVIESPARVPEEAIRAVHSPELLMVYESVIPRAGHLSFYPSVFPVGNDQQLVDPSNIWHSGAFCLDSGTPLHSNTWSASSWSAACAYDGALLLQQSARRVVYSLCRPPGHHATRDHFGGYCYLNNVAIAAQFLKSFGRVAILDIDIHHGNGTQSIFYDSNEVFFLSIHGQPQDHYPYFWGSAHECGVGSGVGFNVNIPLPAGTDGATYLRVLSDLALPKIADFRPDFLLVSAGFDTAVGDPLGTFKLQKNDFLQMGKVISGVAPKILVVQEGGYDTDDLGHNVVAFLSGVVGTGGMGA